MGCSAFHDSGAAEEPGSEPMDNAALFVIPTPTSLPSGRGEARKLAARPRPYDIARRPDRPCSAPRPP
jgi:hypothetical protein